MPELPEVETTVRGLNTKVLKRTFVDVWTDFPKMIHLPCLLPSDYGGQAKTFEQFRKEIKDKKIQKVWRRGKNILFGLSDNKTLLIHQKLTGHLLIGYWILDNECWKPKIKGPLEEKINTYIHLLFTLDSGEMLALSDLRKFAKVELWDTKELKESDRIKGLGPEPLEKGFTFEKFKECLKDKRGKIKQVLMNQSIIAGIGNIYSDEVLWEAKIHPLKDAFRLNTGELKRIYQSLQKILKKAIKLRGESISDFRDIGGEKGHFDSVRKVYRREGEGCFRCNTKIKRIKLGGRSAHFCPDCQKLC